MPKTRKGANPNNKGFTAYIPIQYIDLLELFENTGYVVSKSEIVRSALAEWFMRRLDLIYSLSHAVGHGSVSLEPKEFDRLQKIFEMIKRERDSQGFKGMG